MRHLFSRQEDGKKTYQKLDEFLSKGKDKNDRPYANNTRICRSDKGIAVRLHTTDVITFSDDGKVVLDSGGWKTVTTKDRINQFIPQGFRLYQDRGRWYLMKIPMSQTKPVPFFDGMTLDIFNDSKQQKKALKTEKTNLALIKQINKYCDKLGKMIDERKLQDPSGRDCWYCCMYTTDTHKPLGDAINDNDHIQSHLKEMYIVPSLVLNAMRDKGMGPIWWPMYQRYRETGEKMTFPVRQEIVRAVKRYLKRKLGIAG